MSRRPVVAFYAPMKDPDHPVPSGDRTMARQFVELLDLAGFDVERPTDLRSYVGRSIEGFGAIETAAADETNRILDIYRGALRRPCLWFTYHLYYKAPDLIGPAVSGGLGIPYVVAEASRAPKRADGPWAPSHRRAEAAIDAASLVLALNRRDVPMLESHRPPGQRLALLLPFVDASGWIAARPPARRQEGATLRLLTVAMMRPGDKASSYGALAEALERLPHVDWSLDVVGDGPERAAIEHRFEPFGERVRWHGAVTDRAALSSLYAGADLLAWPGINEAFGMVYLEAALHGCPALAFDAAGVPMVVRHGETGILSPPGASGDFADAIERLAADPDLHLGLALGAHDFAWQERRIEQAAKRVAALLAPHLGRPPVGPR